MSDLHGHRTPAEVVRDLFLGFVPGLLQSRAGQSRRAAVAFLSCTVVFLAGWAIIGSRLYYFAVFTPDDKAPCIVPLLASFGILTTLPEMLNLPASMIGALLDRDFSHEAQRLWRMPRDGEHLAGWVTAASGMLAAFWSADGHWLDRVRRAGAGLTPRPPLNPALAAGLSWLVPGLAHVRAGQKGKGLLVGGAVIAVFAMGLLFSEGHAVDRGGPNSVWWIGQNLFGGGTLFAAFFTAPLEYAAQPKHQDLGLVLCTVAGLMNLVVMVDAYTVAERTVFPVAAQEATA